MQSIYVDGDAPRKPSAENGHLWPLTPEAKALLEKPARPQGGTAHRHGWTEQVRLLRTTLAAVHAACPHNVRGDRESVVLEIMEFAPDLDPRAVHLLRLMFKILWRLSGNGSRRRH